jgi:tripartite-type tricarboxylate transporter receptor subunit TctC
MAAKQDYRAVQGPGSEADAGRRTLLRGAAAMAAFLGTGGMVRAADFPSKPIRLVVPFSAGGATDILGRLLGQAMEPHLKQTVVVDNRPGASGAIGASNVVQSPPDGYSVLMGGVGTNIVLAYTMPTLAYDPVKDLLPVAHVCNVDYVLAVAANSPYQTLDDLLAAARKAPKSISYMSTGPLGPLHVAMEYLSKQAGVSMVHVPYAGEAPSLPDLMTGRIDVAVMTIAFTKPLVADGRVRLLATISGERAAARPELPTVAELGFPGFAVPIWNGFFVPAGTPADVIARLNQVTLAALDRPVRERMIGLGVTPTGTSPQEYADFLNRERERWSTMIRETGVLA